MATIYSSYDAKARFSEIMRRVRAGHRVLISYRGETVAEVRPVYSTGRLDRALRELEHEGILDTPRAPDGKLEPLGEAPGALARFLESRE
jgi:prevent-host-death family protein